MTSSYIIYSKVESGKLELESQPFELRTCLEDALDLLAITASKKRLDLAYLIEPGTPEAIYGDITRLRQIIINLLNNALKFTEKGEVVVSVSSRLLSGGDGKGGAEAKADSSPHYELHFAVRDTGIGIPPDRMDRLFKAFSQVDASTTRKYGGTGLGLIISLRLSELMGGRMWVESEVGVGIIFHFTIQAQTAPPLLARLKQGVAQGNAAEVRAAAHTIKSSSNDFGATRLAELCQTLEDMGKAGALEGAAELAAQVEAE